MGADDRVAAALDELKSNDIRRSLRGYDADDVDAFFEHVKGRLEALRSGPALQFGGGRVEDVTGLIDELDGVQYRLALRGYNVSEVDHLLACLRSALAH